MHHFSLEYRAHLPHKYVKILCFLSGMPVITPLKSIS